MVITKIERQKRNPHRVNIFADGEFAIGLHEETFIKFRLKKGDPIDEGLLREIESSEEFNLAKQKALRLLSYRLRSEKELRTRLKEEEYPPDIIDKTVEFLYGIGVLDDTAFARAFINQSLMRRPVGKSRLHRELRQRGIDKETVQSVLQELLTDHQEHQLADEAAQKLLKRLPPATNKLTEQKQRRRIANFLARSGFPWPTISATLKTIAWRHGADQEEDE